MLDIFESLIFFVCISQSSFELEKTSWMWKISLDFCTVLNHSSLTVLMLEIDWEASLNKAACYVWHHCYTVIQSEMNWYIPLLHEHLYIIQSPVLSRLFAFCSRNITLLFIHCSSLPLFCLGMVLFKKESFCLVFLCIHKCAWHIGEEGTWFKELPPWDWPVGMSVRHFLM